MQPRAGGCNEGVLKSGHAMAHTQVWKLSGLLFLPRIHTQSTDMHISDMLCVHRCMRMGPFIHACRFWGVYRGDSCVLTGAL